MRRYQTQYGERSMSLSPRYVEGHELLAGKSVLITAAAGAGIGFAAARKCVEEGCRAIFVSDIHEGRTAQAVEALKALGGTQLVFGRVANVTVEEQVQALIDEAETRLGGVDVLINNAGLGGTKPLVDSNSGLEAQVAPTASANHSRRRGSAGR